ncbi:TPA: hypothetical protein OMU28_002052 [Klebsiella aerogenes]|nr:hypothetical protein [Klebsiella aerogenes]
MSNDRPVLSLKCKPNPDRAPRNSSVPMMVKGKRLEYPRHRKKSKDSPTSAIDRFNLTGNISPVKRMKRRGSRHRQSQYLLPPPLSVVTRKKGKPDRPARLMDYQDALDLIRNT